MAESQNGSLKSYILPQPSLKYLFPQLHCVTKQFNTPIVVAALSVTFILIQCDNCTVSPFLWRRRGLEDNIKEVR